MAVHYQIEQRELTIGGSKRNIVYARHKSRGEASLEEIETMVSKISAASEGDVRSIIRTMTDLMCYHLSEGRTVVLGDFGRIRPTIKSKASERLEDFDSANIRRVGVIFTPGKMIRQALRGTSVMLSHAAIGKATAKPKAELEEEHGED